MIPPKSLTRLILLWMSGCLLIACAVALPGTAVPTLTAPPPTHTPTVTPTASPPPPTAEPCGFQWATQPLPAETGILQSALDAGGLGSINARAEAFGENCVTAGGAVAYFATMQTDFRLSAPMADLSDEQALGQTVEAVLAVLAALPPETFPGPNRGYLGIQFQQGEQIRNLWVRLDDAQRAFDSGLRGTDLLRELSAGE